MKLRTVQRSAGLACLLSLPVFQLLAGMLEFNRTEIFAGQIWRLWSGHLVHVNYMHLLLNGLAGLALYILFFPLNKSLQPLEKSAQAAINFYCIEFLTVLALSCLLISLGLLFFFPEIIWYRGLSGGLHALFAYFALRRVSMGKRWFWLAFAAVWLKAYAESRGATTGTAELMGDMRIIVEAHLLGVIAGSGLGAAGFTKSFRRHALLKPR